MRSEEAVKAKWGVCISEEVEEAFGNAGIDGHQDLVDLSSEQLEEKGLASFNGVIDLILASGSSAGNGGISGSPDYTWDVSEKTCKKLAEIQVVGWIELSENGQKDPSAIRKILPGKTVMYLNRRLEKLALPLILPMPKKKGSLSPQNTLIPIEDVKKIIKEQLRDETHLIRSLFLDDFPGKVADEVEKRIAKNPSGDLGQGEKGVILAVLDWVDKLDDDKEGLDILKALLKVIISRK